MEDITYDEDNQSILRRLKNNDPDLTELWLRCLKHDDYDYVPTGQNDNDFGWLGYFVGNNTQLAKLVINLNEDDMVGGVVDCPLTEEQIELFCIGLNRNKSIRELRFSECTASIFGGTVFQMMYPFFKSNRNLTSIKVDLVQLGADSCRNLALALGTLTNGSLTHFGLNFNHIGDDGRLGDIIAALSTHPKLKILKVTGNGIGRNGCIALATLIRCTATELQSLDLQANNIDGEGLDELVGALHHSSNLKTFNLTENLAISIRGWKALSVLLENPNSKLETLSLSGNNVESNGAIIFANALANNRKLKVLELLRCDITEEGWSAFTKLLCDTSSVNKTFLSNHTLEVICRRGAMPVEVQSLLGLNLRNLDKNKVAIAKILQHHQYFNMQPFFEWDLKVLPCIIDWFARADAFELGFEGNIRQRKLSSIYQFIRGMPMTFVESISRQELEKIRSDEMKLQRQQLELHRMQLELTVQLKEMEDRRSRVTRRLMR